MKYVNLGFAGVRVSQICLGTMTFGNSAEWMVELEKATPIIKRALDLGINFFDTANVYSDGRSEEILGEIIKDYRNDTIIATKVGWPLSNFPNHGGLSRIHIIREVEKSLKRLRTDYIDLYQAHRWDYNTPVVETLEAFDDLIQQGKVMYVGASSMYAWQFAKALFTSDIYHFSRFVSMQNHYNLCYREEEREMVSLCKDQDIALVSWSPLARGFLTGKYKRGEISDSGRYKFDKSLTARYFRPQDFDVLESVEAIAKEKGVKPSQVSLSWLLNKGVAAPIVGASKVEHIEEAVESIGVHLTSDDMKRLEEPYQTRPIIGHS